MENKQNKLDDFLRRQLNDSSEDHAWNVPEDAIFETAMRSIAAEKKKKRRGLIIIPFLIGAVLIGSEYIHNRQIKVLQGKIAHLEESILPQSTGTAPSPSSAQNISSDAQTSNRLTSTEINSTEISVKPNTQNISKLLPSDPTSPVSSKTFSQPNVSASQVNNDVASAIPVGIQPANDADVHPEEGFESNMLPLQSPSLWITLPVETLLLSGVQNEQRLIIIPELTPLLPSPSSITHIVPAMSYGLLLCTNQSWLTMKNIPDTKDARLYAYDNNQPGVGAYGFITKPVSPKFSVQTGIGYQVFNNKSILEDQFLFDSEKVTQTPSGSMYQTDYEVINPLGEYNTMLEFRVSDQMHENDIIIESTEIEQTLQVVNLDLSLNYTLIKVRDFDVSLGAGLNLGLRSGLKNEFNVSSYHNDILQGYQTEIPGQLNNVRRWYLQALGKLSLGYHLSDRFGLVAETQYSAALTSIRNGSASNGPQTYLHAFFISAGISHSF